MVGVFVLQLLLLLFGLQGSLGVPLEFFFPFNDISSNDTFELPKSLDGVFQFPADYQGVKGEFVFFDRAYNTSELYISNNGLLSLGTGFSYYTPEEFPINITDPSSIYYYLSQVGLPPLIAPYWADHDSRGTGSLWLKSSNDTQDLLKVRDIVAAAFPGITEFDASNFLVVATWDRIGYYELQTDKTNTFQCILASDGSLSFVIFLYADEEIQWTTSQEHGGEFGLGGTHPAVAGIDAGNGEDFILIEDSFTDSIINITQQSNVDWPGMFVFQVNGDTVQRPSESQLRISPWYGHAFGGEPITVSGPNFDETDKIICLFDQLEVEALFVSAETAVCPSPRVIKDPGTRVEFGLRINDYLLEAKAAFYPLSREDDGDVQISSSYNTLLFHQGNQLTITWDPASTRASVADILSPDDHDSILVDVKLFEINPINYDLTEIRVLLSQEPNDGSATVTLDVDSILQDDAAPHMTTIVVQPIMPSDSSPVSKRFVSSLSKIGKWTGIFFIGRLLACAAWLATEPPTVGQEILDKVREVFPCPPTFAQASSDNSFKKDNPNSVKIFHPQAENCFRQKPGTESLTNGYGNQCCYDKAGNIIVGPNSGGTVDKVAPSGTAATIKHFFVDVLPFTLCCPEFCHEYYKRRHSDDGTAYDPPPPALWIGDPHIVTLDLYKYTFNGKGEYVLIETDDNLFTMQGRMVEAATANGSNATATVFSALVAKQDSSDLVQIELFNDELIVMVNRKKADFSVLKEQQFRNVSVSFEGNDTVAVTFSRKESIKVVSSNGFLSTMIFSLPKSYIGKTRGLLGSYNGNGFDDLVPKGADSPLPIDSTIKQIHEQFGITWIIDDPAASLFTYQFGLQWGMFYGPNFVPMYEPDFADSHLQAKAKEICGEDQSCLFDIAATGNLEIGEATLEGEIAFNTLIELLKPIICDPPCANGACVANDTCACSEGYTGDLCQTIVYSNCTEPNKCENGATSCKVHVTHVICTCPLHYTGDYCQDFECGCKNNGTCVQRESSWYCMCLDGFTGETCDQLTTDTESERNTGVIVGTTVGVVLAVVLVVILAVVVIAHFVFHRVKKNKTAA